MAEPPVLDRIAAAWTLLQRNAHSTEIVALVEPIRADDPRYAEALHVRGALAGRDGDPSGARDLLLEAIRRGEPSVRVWLHLAAAAGSLGLPDDLAAMLLDLLRRVAPAQLPSLTGQILQALRFTGAPPHAGQAAVFEKLLLPLLALLLDRDEMDAAIGLESLIYEAYAKPTETEAHFAATMGRIEPLFTAAGRRWRAKLPPPTQSLAPPYRVGFFLHNASMLAHVEVLLNALKGYRRLDDQPFEPIVYVFGGKSPQMEAAFAALNVRLVNLNERFPETERSHWARLLRLRELIAEEGVQQLVWISLVAMMPLAFGLRIAPVQTWWAMKYRNFSQPDIDGYITGSALTPFGDVAGRRWRMTRLGVDDWYDAALEPEAARLRAALGDRTVLMTLARTEKMIAVEYLEAMVRILQARPDAVFLWAGREENPRVVEALRDGGVLDQTRFIGWVNTRLYVQVADVFLDTFPAPCGFTLFQAMAAGKPVVIYDSHEAAQTGLWNFLRPLVDGQEGRLEDRAELASIIGSASDPKIAIARGLEDYVRYALRLIDGPARRHEAGAAARCFIDRYFSDPRDLGASMSEHVLALLEAGRNQVAN